MPALMAGKEMIENYSVFMLWHEHRVKCVFDQLGLLLHTDFRSQIPITIGHYHKFDRRIDT